MLVGSLMGITAQLWDSGAPTFGTPRSFAWRSSVSRAELVDGSAPPLLASVMMRLPAWEGGPRGGARVGGAEGSRGREWLASCCSS
jgi:hypothetical protein